MVYKKRAQSVKQIKKHIEYKQPSEQRRCSSCKFFINDVYTHSNSNRYKCTQYRITIQAGGICVSYIPNK